MSRTDDILNVHSLLPASRANGPGVRFAVWFQGCTLDCLGCFNPETHSVAPRRLMAVDDLFQHILESGPSVEGITLTGGEPFLQPDPLCRLLRRVRSQTDLSVLAFSGYTLDEIKGLRHGETLIRMIDVLIDGRYVEALRTEDALRGSSNQRIHLLTDRYDMDDLARVPRTEVRIDEHGDIQISGFPGRSRSELQKAFAGSGP